eukprot:6584304-Prymnesium_polylepis.1
MLRLMRLADVGGMLHPPAQVCAATRAMPSRSLLCTARAAARIGPAQDVPKQKAHEKHRNTPVATRIESVAKSRWSPILQ